MTKLISTLRALSLPAGYIVALAIAVYLTLSHNWALFAVLVGLVVAHEFGHWIVARLFGIPVPVFSVGMGSKPRIKVGKFFGTEFQVTPWLIGGYVAIDPSKKEFYETAAWKRVAVLFGGVAMNWITACVIMFCTFVTMGAPIGQSGSFQKVAVPQAAGAAYHFTEQTTVLVVDALAQAFHLKAADPAMPGSADLHSIVSVFQYGSTVNSAFNLAVLAAVISINLAVINLLPIPLLDGGHILYVCLEKILGRERAVTIQENTAWIGFVALIALFVIGLFNDIFKPISMG